MLEEKDREHVQLITDYENKMKSNGRQLPDGDLSSFFIFCDTPVISTYFDLASPKLLYILFT